MITDLIDEKFLLVFQLNQFSRLHQAPERFLSIVSMTKFELAQPMRKKQKKILKNKIKCESKERSYFMRCLCLDSICCHHCL